MREYSSLRWWTKTDNKAAKNDFQPDLSSFKSSKATEAPDWDKIPSKDTAMSEEEFEEAIAALALKAAEKGMALGDADKGREALKQEEWDLLTKYISVVSPDRKTAYASSKGNDVVYGGLNQELMNYSNGQWNTKLNSAELSRASKFYEIFNNATKEYEAEHGQIPQTQKKAASTSTAQYQTLLNPLTHKSYSLLNYLA
jgi:hypothetical protein